MPVIDPDDVWECEECGHTNVRDDRCGNCYTARQWSRAAIEDEIDGAHEDADMTIERVMLALFDLAESEYVRRSPTFGFLVETFFVAIRQLKLTVDFRTASPTRRPTCSREWSRRTTNCGSGCWRLSGKLMAPTPPGTPSTPCSGPTWPRCSRN